MLSDLYSEKLLDAAAAIPPAGRLASPQASAKKVSRVCGSEIEVDLNVDDSADGVIVSDFALRARACALGQASASIVARNIIGASPAELYALRDAIRAMLKAGGPPPDGARWAELEALSAIRDYPQRHASTLLVFDAVCACLDELGFSPV